MFNWIQMDDLMKLTYILTKDSRQMEQLYRRMCFNVFAHNRDDHSKNFSYLYDDTQQYHCSFFSSFFHPGDTIRIIPLLSSCSRSNLHICFNFLRRLMPLAKMTSIPGKIITAYTGLYSRNRFIDFFRSHGRIHQLCIL